MPEFKPGWEKYMKMPFLEVIQKWDETYDHEDGTLLNKEEYLGLRDFIAWTLDLVTSDELNKKIEKMENHIKELEAELRAHRHKTIGGLFTDTPTGRA
ncbi:MAG: hypothetical protein ACTSSA_11800 [Candidatus Freyarchaeota archaeon]